MNPARAWLTLLAMLLGWPAGGAIRDGGVDPANLGKGDWIYSMMDATNQLSGHVSSVTNETSLMLFYKSIGVRYLMVKAGTGAALYNGCYSGPQFTAALCNVARANGIWIFGYNRSYATNTAGEVAIANYVFNQGADGFVWDAESEWESATIGSQGPALAWAQCSQVRSNWPTKFLAHAPFPIISYHSSFPYKEFGYWCDAVIPQIYHSGWTGVKGTASGGINWSDVNWANWQKSLVGSNNVVGGQTIWWTNAVKPLAPAENVYGPANPYLCNGPASQLRDKDVMEFIDYLSCDPNSPSPGGYNGANFWRADLHGAAQFANIAAGTVGPFPGRVSNIVIDDPRATTSAGWTAVRTYYNGTFSGDGSGSDTNSFGTNYLVRTRGSGTVYALFRPQIAVPGDYNVYQWHVYLPNASASVPHIVAFDGGTAVVNANQQTNSGNWSFLGRYPFAAGSAGYVQVTDGISEAGAVAIADGMKFVFIAPTSVPVAPTGLNATPVGTSQVNLAWVDTATNETGFVISRSLGQGGPYTDIGSVGRGATTYTNTGLQPSTTYYYLVRATNWLGASANSAHAAAMTLGTSTPPGITSQPQSQTVTAGRDATFSVTVSGATPLSYQWWFGPTPVGGATNQAYTRTNTQAADAGEYYVVVTNLLGGATSAPATLTVNFSVTATAGSGGAVTRSPDATNYPPGSSVTLTAIPNSGYAFSGWSGAITGSQNPVTLTITNNLDVTANFVSADLIIDNIDGQASFTPDASWTTGTSSGDKYGSNYRWASTAEGGTATADYRPLIPAAGYYDVFIWYPQGSNRATNAAWSVSHFGGTSDVTINQTVNGGQWVSLASARPLQLGSAGFVRLVNASAQTGKVVMADAVRFVYAGAFPSAPAITAPPQSQTVKAGSNVLFTVAVSGTGPFRYQWLFNGQALAGETQGSYSRPNAQTNHSGPYQVVVSNLGGFTTSSAAILTVLPRQPPLIISQPSSRSAAPGGSASFVVAASSPSPVRYQWRLNDGDLPAETNVILVVTPVLAANLGSYRALAVNDDGSVLSDPALLTFALAPQILAPVAGDTGFRLSFATEFGPKYVVEYQTELNDGSWQVLTNMAGTGALCEVTDAPPTNQARLYRLRLE